MVPKTHETPISSSSAISSSASFGKLPESKVVPKDVVLEQHQRREGNPQISENTRNTLDTSFNFDPGVTTSRALRSEERFAFVDAAGRILNHDKNATPDVTNDEIAHARSSSSFLEEAETSLMEQPSDAHAASHSHQHHHSPTHHHSHHNTGHHQHVGHSSHQHTHHHGKHHHTSHQHHINPKHDAKQHQHHHDHDAHHLHNKGHHHQHNSKNLHNPNTNHQNSEGKHLPKKPPKNVKKLNRSELKKIDPARETSVGIGPMAGTKLEHPNTRWIPPGEQRPLDISPASKFFTKDRANYGGSREEGRTSLSILQYNLAMKPDFLERQYETGYQRALRTVDIYLGRIRAERQLDAALFQSLWTLPFDVDGAEILSDGMVEKRGMRGCSSPLIGQDYDTYDTQGSGLMTCYGERLKPSSLCLPKQISLSEMNRGFYPSVINITSTEHGFNERTAEGIRPLPGDITFEYKWRAFYQAGYGRIYKFGVSAVPIWIVFTMFISLLLLFLRFKAADKTYRDAQTVDQSPEDVIEGKDNPGLVKSEGDDKETPGLESDTAIADDESVVNDQETPPAVLMENPKQIYLKARAAFTKWEVTITIWLIFCGLTVIVASLDVPTHLKIDAFLLNIPMKFTDYILEDTNWIAMLNCVFILFNFFVIAFLFWFIVFETITKRSRVEKKLQRGESIRRRETAVIGFTCPAFTFLWLGLPLLLTFVLLVTPRAGIWKAGTPPQYKCDMNLQGGHMRLNGYNQTWHFHPFQHVAYADAPTRKGILMGIFDAPKNLNSKVLGEFKLLLFNTDMASEMPSKGPASPRVGIGGRSEAQLEALQETVTKDDAYRIFFQYLELCFFVDLCLRMAQEQYPGERIIAQVGGSFHFDPGRMSEHALQWLREMVEIIDAEELKNDFKDLRGSIAHRKMTEGILKEDVAKFDEQTEIDATTPMMFMLNMYKTYPKKGLVLGENTVTKTGAAFPWPLLRTTKSPVCVDGGGMQVDRGTWEENVIDIQERKEDLERCNFSGSWTIENGREVIDYDNLHRSDFSFTIPRGSMTNGEPGNMVQTIDIQSDFAGVFPEHGEALQISSHVPIWTRLKWENGIAPFSEGITYDSHDDLWFRMAKMHKKITDNRNTFRFRILFWLPVLLLVCGIISLNIAFILYGQELERLEGGFQTGIQLEDFDYEPPLEDIKNDGEDENQEIDSKESQKKSKQINTTTEIKRSTSQHENNRSKTPTGTNNKGSYSTNFGITSSDEENKKVGQNSQVAARQYTKDSNAVLGSPQTPTSERGQQIKQNESSSPPKQFSRAGP